MGIFLGIDTSNYTTSMALWDTDSQKLIQRKKLLSVQEGALGLRQSDALFQHIRQLPAMAEDLCKNPTNAYLSGIGVSTQPRRQRDSYMPCFLAGESQAKTMAAVFHIPLFSFSHQEGHIAAALYGSNHLDWLERPFLAFHFSGGTSEGLYVRPKGQWIEVKRVAASLDLKAGQAVDRVGQMLGLPFPSGPRLEELAAKSQKSFSVRPAMKDCNCSLSGVENQCRAMLKNGERPEDIAQYCLVFLTESIGAMIEALMQRYNGIPLLFAGGVMCNRFIRQNIEKRYGGVFCPPFFSSDNAAGIAVLAAKSFAGGLKCPKVQ